MTSRPNRQLRRQLESELRDLAVPPTPNDLLAKIRAEIPADLRAANSEEPAPAAPRRFLGSPGFRLAASIAVAVVGVALGYRALERDRNSSSELVAPAESRVRAAKGARLETPAVSDVASQRADKDEKLPLKGKTKEVGADASEPSTGQRRSDQVAQRVESLPREEEAFGLEISQAQLAAPPAPAAPPSEQKMEPEKLQALGYIGGGVAAASPAPNAPAASSDRANAEAKQRDAADSANEEHGARTETLTVTAESPLLDARSLESRQRTAAVAAPKPSSAASARSESLEKRAAPGANADRDHAPSTDGERAPNEQAAGDMFFRATGTNPFVDTAEDRLSTFALDVDTGSWTLARSYLERGSLPPAEAIRVEEFVNAQSYDDPAPRRGDFTLVAEGAPSPFGAGEQYRLLRFAVKAREIDARDRKPANLTFVVDVSGSMSQENRLGLVKRALGLLLDELRGDDRVALVVYGTQGRVLLRHTRDLEAIREAIAALRPEGSTNAEAGLRFGYDLADEAWRRDAINRVILCSDGVANVGATGPESILERIGAEARRGIELTTVGFGMGNYNDALMEQLADQGDGAYHYVDTLDEARRIFVENLSGTLQTVAKDAKVQVEFDPRVVDRWRLVGYENRDVADRNFRNDAVDAGEIGVGHSAVALYEVRLRDGARGGDPVGTLRLRWKSRATRQVEEAALTLEVADLEDSFRRASGNLRTAAVAAELAELLKGSYYAREAGWTTLASEAHRLERESRGSGSLRDLVALVDRASVIGGRRVPPRSEGDRREDD